MEGHLAEDGSFPSDDGLGSSPAFAPEDDDFDLDEHFAWLAAMCGPDGPDGPDGLGGQAVRAAFGQDKAADVLRPGPVLAALTAQGVSSSGSLTDSELVGVLQAARRLAMEAGTVDLGRACTIASRTRVMNDTDAAYADEVLAEAAPELRPDQLARKAAALEMKLAPEAVRARKELAKRLDQRVESRREESGNASLSGRELDTTDVMASKAYIDAVALKLRGSGLVDGTLDRLRGLALVDLTQGRDPLDRIRPTRVTTASPEAAAVADELGQGPQSGPIAPGDPAPLPALINLLVPAGTVLGWGMAPGQAAGWGLLDVDETGALIRAASLHPRTRWCFTLTAPDGTAIAHGCAAGQHPWKPPDPQTLRRPGDIPTPKQSAQLTDLLRRMKVTFEPIARDACVHRHAEDRYVPSRKLKHLLHARSQTCTAPACNAQAQYCDIDHTIPYPDGPTCECNTNPKCRRRHRVKQAPAGK